MGKFPGVPDAVHASNISIVSGENQSGVRWIPLGRPFVVSVADFEDLPVVRWEVTQGSGTFSPSNVTNPVMQSSAHPGQMVARLAPRSVHQRAGAFDMPST